MMFRLDGRRAIVTGASRGIGAAMSVALAEAGADLVLVARGDLESTRADIEKLGRGVTVVNADLADRSAPAAILDAAGEADILVNNAGIIRRANAIDYSDEDWDAVLDVNLRSVFVLSRNFAKALVARNSPGRIINVASMLSFQGGIRVPAYTAAKSGLLGLTRALANELAPSGINVNAIAPGYIATDNTEALRNDPVRSKEILARIPAGRWGTPHDLEGVTVFLASQASAYVHGAVIPIDGGWLSR
jgi:2-dehydro-3-deoxy-D-gluconate 5-dehydrogenase